MASTQDDASSIVSSVVSRDTESTGSSLRRRRLGASALARAFLFQRDIPGADWSPPVLPPAFAEIVTFACGQVELCREEAAEDVGDRLVFKGYIEFSAQVTPARIRTWIQADEDVEFLSAPAFIKDREKLIKSRTSPDTRYKGPDDLILPAAWSFGEIARGAAGERTDMDDIREILREFGPEEGIKRVGEKYPGQFIRYANGITQLAQLVVPRVRESTEFVFRPWQAAIHKIALSKPHSRHIYWIEDGKGNSGKSRLTAWMCREMNAIELDGRLMDAAFSYTGQAVVIFDVARCIDTHTLKDMYAIAEKLKNGQLYSAKYQSRLKVFHTPHVFFFSNSPPPVGVWSADRLQHIVLSQADVFQPFSHELAGAPEVAESGLDLFNGFLEAENTARAKKAALEDAARQEEANREEDLAEIAEYDLEQEKTTAEQRIQMKAKMDAQIEEKRKRQRDE